MLDSLQSCRGYLRTVELDGVDYPFMAESALLSLDIGIAPENIVLSSIRPAVLYVRVPHPAMEITCREGVIRLTCGDFLLWTWSEGKGGGADGG